MIALVIANGEPPPAVTLQELAAHASLVVAADGGAHAALDADVDLNAVVGDLDSLSRDARLRLPAGIIHPDFDPDRTDLQKAVDFVLARGATTVNIVAAGGGRLDHTLGNLSLLALYPGRNLRILDDRFVVTRVEGTARIDGHIGTVVSLVAIGTCSGVTTTGLRWPLTNATLPFSPRGVHNEVASSPAFVRVASGDLLLLEGRWVEKHA
jgi:thiamine pyrophosphokinase